MAINDGGSAFPLPFVRVEDRDGYTENLTAADIDHGGMTLRDYFAAHALSGLLASESHPVLAETRIEIAGHNGRSYSEQLSIEAYELADAMLKARGV